MQNNNILKLVILGLLMLLSMWAASALIELRPGTRNYILALGGFLLLLMVLWRKVPLDAKLLFIVILGYAFGGKGFAYVSPFEPIYIGEITMVLCLCGLLLRSKSQSLIDTSIHKFVWALLIYGGIHLIIDFQAYKLLAIRDSATAYYSVFFITSYALFRNEAVVDRFEKILKMAVVLAMMQFTYGTLGFRGITGMSAMVDAFLPLLAGGALLFLSKGMERKQIINILLGVIAVAMLCSGKTAPFLALLVVIFCAIVWGRITGLVVPTLIIGALGITGLAITTIASQEMVIGAITGADTVQAFGVEDGEFVGFADSASTESTSTWRWTWWTIIWNDTMHYAPFYGMGFGADISSSFLTEWLGPEYANAENYARYPHNVIFTVIGRLGLIGLVIFLFLYINIWILCLKFSRRYFRSPLRRDCDVLAFGVVVAGLVNGVLQTTYEAPYVAITHWVCIGYIAVRYYGPGKNISSQRQNEVVNEIRIYT